MNGHEIEMSDHEIEMFLRDCEKRSMGYASHTPSGKLGVLVRIVRDMERRIAGYQAECNEVEQILGKALGYPFYKDDQLNFPGTTEANGVFVGAHTPATLASEVAKRLTCGAAAEVA